MRARSIRGKRFPNGPLPQTPPTLPERGGVTGSVVIAPPVQGCPFVTYQVGGNYSPSIITDGSVPSYTGFVWKASNPVPSGQCGSWTPEQTVTYTGTIVNATNDYGSGQATNSDGYSGQFQIFASSEYIPAGETITDAAFGVGLYATQATFTQSIADTPQEENVDPNDTLFQGRQIFENLYPGSTVHDGCWEASGGTAPFGSFTVLGTIWNVGSSGLNDPNEYEDTVGWSPADVAWYRQHLPQASFPCTAEIDQAMNILHSNPSNPTSGEVMYSRYANHTIAVTIGINTLTVSKDGYSRTTSY